MHLQWSGDVDFNTGDLQQSYQAYRNLLAVEELQKLLKDPTRPA